ncbi:ATP-binding cassette domain-containing protein [Pseudonocardia sp. WMMC193]|uniref:ATP-binding cassette domain-containing protein n=1 Tax=Pseudonocardia sp. WMMC193 TaxID=2911965 RepID=UPI001F00B4B6|nr:ATP-binding cassette domain-containing protein [Pseudonocardia sp. WMMC193]MCF7548219.1 ATP-binding cassette domain-containing protein [Pseudonocardia sp. WMMC193]
MTLRAAGPLLAGLALVAAWEVLARVVGSAALPPPSAVVGAVVADGPAFYLRNLEPTARAAAEGWGWGTVLALTSGALVAVVPRAGGTVLRFALVTYCLPLVAVGPLLAATVGGRTPQVVLAALAVFFPTVVGLESGLRATTAPVVRTARAFGAGEVRLLRHVRWRAALPDLLAGVRVAAPSAVLGAVIGEYLGAESGLGVALVAAQQSLAVERTWALGVVAAAAAGTAYAAVGLLGRVLVPWAPHREAGVPGLPGRDRGPLAALVAGLGSVLALAVLWELLLLGLRLDPFLARGPVDVLRYLVTDPAGTRSALIVATGTTLWHALLGLVVGAAAAIAAAVVFVLVPAAGRVLLPPALALRSVPLVAMTPLLALVLGRGPVAVAAVTAIVTFFPVLTGLVVAMRGTPATMVDVGRAFGGSPAAVLARVRFVHALPALFAALRMAAPLALTGALLAEWLVTGDGLGHLMLLTLTSFDLGLLWSAVVVVTVCSLALYAVTATVERRVARRLGAAPPAPPRRSRTRRTEPGREPGGSGIRLDGVGLRYPDGLVALDGVDLDLPSGCVTALLGPSGCGKSTLLALLAGLEEPGTGTLRVEGRPPGDLRRAHRIGVALQDPALLPWRTVAGNIRLPLQLAGAARADDRVADLVERVGLAGFARATPAQLSGGMRQRVALARALVATPDLLLLDEPFGALDDITRQRMNAELRTVVAASGVTTVLVTHSVTEAAFLADRVVVLSPRPGRVVAVLDTDLPADRDLTLLRSPEFHALTDRIAAHVDGLATAAPA